MSGAFDSCEATVESIDDITPEVTAPSDVTLSTGLGDADCQVEFVVPDATVGDNFDPIPTESNDASLLFTLGSTMVIYTASDDSGNPATDTMTVTVIDSTRPEVLCSVAEGSLWHQIGGWSELVCRSQSRTTATRRRRTRVSSRTRSIQNEGHRNSPAAVLRELSSLLEYPESTPEFEQRQPGGTQPLTSSTSRLLGGCVQSS